MPLFIFSDKAVVIPGCIRNMIAEITFHHLAVVSSHFHYFCWLINTCKWQQCVTVIVSFHGLYSCNVFFDVSLCSALYSVVNCACLCSTYHAARVSLPRFPVVRLNKGSSAWLCIFFTFAISCIFLCFDVEFIC